MTRILRMAAPVIALAAMLSGCIIDLPPGGGGPQYVGFDVGSDFNSQQDNGGTCNFAPVDTQFGTFIRHYNGGPEVVGPVFYYAPQANATTYLNVYTGGIGDPNIRQHNSAALQVWSLTLNGHVPAGHYYTLLPQESNDSTSVAQEYTNSSAPGYPANTALGLTSDGNWIGAAVVNFFTPDMPGQTDAIYAVALHELGHSMGLAHNPYQGSVMYPRIDNSGQDVCYYYVGGNVNAASAPIAPDWHQLEAKYDPAFKYPHDPGGGCKPRCLNSGHSLPSLAGLNTPAKRIAFMKGLRWLRVEDPLDEHRASPETLVLSSPAIVEGVPGPSLQIVRDGGERWVIRSFHVDSVLRSDGVAVRPHTTIYVADPQLWFGAEYADSPSIKAGYHYVLFLRKPLSNDRAFRGDSSVLVPTVDRVGKWLLDPSLHLHVLGAFSSRVHRDVEGRSLSQLFATVASHYGAASTINPQRAISEMLQRRGIVTPIQTFNYQRQLMQNPVRLFGALASQDPPVRPIGHPPRR